jgi:hypothetical protein
MNAPAGIGSPVRPPRREDSRLQAFASKVHTALISVIDSHPRPGILLCLWAAYQYRRQFPWLGESGELPGTEDGVAYALGQALACYTFNPGGYEPDAATVDGFRQVEPLWRQQIQRASEAVATDWSSLSRFRHALVFEGIDADGASSDDLVPHVADALYEYCSRQTAGTSLEPW